MTQTNTNNNLNDYEIDLSELLNVLFQRKLIIISFTSFITIIGVIYSLLLPNIYESKALLAPVNSSSSISGALGAYNGLAGLAGINLPSSGDESNSAKAIKKIGSLSFFENNIITNIYLPDLMAVKSWNSKTNKISFDNDIYDTSTNTWVRDFSHPQLQIPSAQESFKVFTRKHLSLSEDKKTGFVYLSIKHQSPLVARQWAELVVNEVNNFYRQKDKLESEKAASYLNQQISLTSLSEIKEVLAQLLQEETKKLALIEANKFYVFDYIDPPALMEIKSEPNRLVIFMISALFGMVISILLVFIKHYANNKVS